MRRTRVLAFGGGSAVVAAALIIGLTSGGGNSPSGPSAQAETQGTEQQAVLEDGRTLPLVEGGDPNNPILPAESNADERTPVVHEGEVTPTWGALNDLLGGDKSYTDCVEQKVTLQWVPDITKFKASEDQGVDLRYIQVIASAEAEVLTNDEVKARLERAGITGMKNLQIQRLPHIINTRGFKNRSGCEEVVDRRPQIRISLGVPVYDSNGVATHLLPGKGVFEDCHNPWYYAKIVEEKKKPKPESTTSAATPPPGPGTSTTPPTTVVTTTTRPHDECPEPGIQPPGHPCAKNSNAPQPPGVEKPVDNPVAPTAEPRPTQDTPLQPDPQPEPEPTSSTTRPTPPPDNQGGDNDGCVPVPGGDPCP